MAGVLRVRVVGGCVYAGMSSGFGAWGGKGRCYPHWQEFTKCVDKNGDAKVCGMEAEDYVECLHHRKQVRAG